MTTQPVTAEDVEWLKKEISDVADGTGFCRFGDIEEAHRIIDRLSLMASVGDKV